MANSDKQLTAKQVATAVLEKVGELLHKSELVKTEKGVHRQGGFGSKPGESSAGAAMRISNIHSISAPSPSMSSNHPDPSGHLGAAKEWKNKAVASHKQVLGELKGMPKPNLPKSEDMEKAEGYKPENSEKENAKPSEHNSKDAMQHADGPGPKGEIHPKEKEAGDPTNESRPTPPPGNNPKEKAEGNNELAGTTPTQVGQDGKNKPGYDEMKGHLKLAKFIGRMEHKRERNLSNAQTQLESTTQHKEVVGSK